jgi:hypothetical protein
MKTNKFVTALAGTILVMGVLVTARAQDKPLDPSGTYIWTMAGRNGGSDRTNTLVLKVDGGNLTGKLSAPGRDGTATDVDITGGKVTGADVSFCVVRFYNGNSMTNSYTGTVSDGSIKGKIEMNRNGDVQSRDWNAKLQQ